MTMNLTAITFVGLLSFTPLSAAEPNFSQITKPLRDGFVLTEIDGRLICEQGNTPEQAKPPTAAAIDKWLFKLDSDVSDGPGIIRAGQSIPLLPSAGLEKMVANQKQHGQVSYRLYGAIVTNYKGKNFIFPNYFLAISQEQKSSPQSNPQIPINEPNDAFTVPQQVIDKLAARKIIRTDQLMQGLKLNQDFILADRTARLVAQGDGESVFVFDALGRNIQEFSLKVLPSELLQRIQLHQAAEPNPVRFTIAGIVTKYNNDHYLLLQKVARVYSHGNFF